MADKTSKPAPCRFFQTSKGCRAGDACPYRHDKVEGVANTDHEAASSTKTRSAAPLVDRSKVVAKPIPATEDARSFQLGQIKRRFRTSPITSDNGDRFVFDLTPSDPDFPYDLDALNCQLDVPTTYPSQGLPSLKVLNKEVPRGFQINIERGFTALAQQARQATLLGLLNRLDRQLESILSGDMAETIKIVVNKPAVASSKALSATTSPPAQHDKSSQIYPAYTALERSEARDRRGLETRQLEARFGRLPAFAKSSDGLRFTLPLDSPKKSTWPPSIQQLRICTVIVPKLYPLESPTLVLDSESIEASNASQAFSDKASTNKALSLTQLINHLLINMREMSIQVAKPVQPDSNAHQVQPQPPTTSAKTAIVHDPDKPHILTIPRPPEWTMESSTDESEDYSTSEEEVHTSAGEEDTTESSVPTSAPVERGVLLSFPQLEMHGIELLELTSLNLTVKCTRCRETKDVERLRTAITEDTTTMAEPRTESCRKCAQPMSIGFRADLMHASSVRAGYLDLDGCTPADVLASSFTPTCSECSTAHPSIVAVRAETAMAICRTCHRKMTLHIKEERFLRMSAIRTSRLPGRKKEKEKLGIVAGTELPRRGRCSHYAKSYRWFRFSCCSKVFACDRCHDDEVDHPNEHANRMLCGFCSREQNYRPEDCGICHAVLVGQKGHGFWEGGKGTRDKARMSRKDPRKYKRVGGGQTRKT